MCSDRLLRGARRVAVAAALVAAVAGNAQTPPRMEKDPGRRFYADDPLWRDADDRDIPPVAEFELSKSYDFLHNSFGDPAPWPGPSLNVNTLGEVPDSSWFTNRIGRFDMTAEDVVRGPDQTGGPAPGEWQVTGRPEAGITPKFTIRDARGDTYLIKLDPPGNPELPSSVELISTKIFHAIGYHVPEDYIVTFDPARLAAAPGATARTVSGGRKPIERADIDRWLRGQARRADGTFRAIASRYVPGKVVGQFLYTGTRPDDPNDLYPHDRRRELRGLRVFAAWLNHDDARSLNSIDTYVEENGRRYIRHYLQDFGSNLGSGSTSAQQPRGGYEYLIETDKIRKGLFSFGFWMRDWMRAKYPDDPTLGNIEADFYQPENWKTEYPQPGFAQMDGADAFWAASILARFTDDIIRRVVAEGQLSHEEAASYLADVIIRRRDKTLAWAITQTNPLDRIGANGGADAAELTFENAAERVGVAERGATYEVQWASLDNRTAETQPAGSPVSAPQRRLSVPAAAWGPPDGADVRYAVASIRTMHPAFPGWASPVVVTLRNRDGKVDVVGIERPTGR